MARLEKRTLSCDWSKVVEMIGGQRALRVAIHASQEVAKRHHGFSIEPGLALC